MAATKKAPRLASKVVVIQYRDVKTGKLGEKKYARLSDPTMKTAMADKAKKLSESPAAALKFLRSIGVATPTGRLAKRFGG